MDNQDQNLTTADLAGRATGQQAPQERPFDEQPHGDEADGAPLLSPQEADI